MLVLRIVAVVQGGRKFNYTSPSRGKHAPVVYPRAMLLFPTIQVNFLPLGSTLPLRVEEKEQERDVSFREVIDGGPRGNMGNMSVQGNGLELTYKRSARRRGGVEAALGAFSLVDMSPATVFSRIISPGTTVTACLYRLTTVCKI